MSCHHHNHYVVSVRACVDRMSCFYFILAVSFCLTNSKHICAARVRSGSESEPGPGLGSPEEKRDASAHIPAGFFSGLVCLPAGPAPREDLQERTRGYDVCQRVTRYQSEPYRRQERQRIGECAWNRRVCIIVIIKGQTVMIICRICNT